jgi:predicted porin
VGPIALALSHQEAGNQVGEFNGAEGSTGQRISVISATYVEGKLKSNTQYFTYDNQKTGNTTAAKVFRLSATYDLGMATVGGGLQKATYDSSATGTNYGLSVSVPMGALTVGAMLGSRVTDGFAAATSNGTQSSYSLNANYALSKRTGVTGQYSNWDNGVGSVNKSNMALLLLTHSF